MAKNLIGTVVSERSDVELDQQDLLNIQEQMVDWMLEVPDEKAGLYTVSKAGISEGAISIAFDNCEGVAWFLERVRDLKPIKEGGPGYLFFGPGKDPSRLFKVLLSDRRSATEPGRFVEVVKKLNPTLRNGQFKVASVLANKEGEGNKGPVVVLSVKTDRATAETLKSMDFTVKFVLGTIFFEERTKGKKAAFSQEQVMDVSD